jgi:hypothetical protein
MRHSRLSLADLDKRVFEAFEIRSGLEPEADAGIV